VTTIPRPNFSHLMSLSGPLGTHEHAEYARARVEHGFCTDDVARVLLVASREPQPCESLRSLALSSMDFLEGAQEDDGTFRNRRDGLGKWFGPSTSDDCWGRSLWALGTVIARCDDEELRQRAVALFERGAPVRSPWPRAVAFAVLGASEVIASERSCEGARELVEAAVVVLDRPDVGAEWTWPEPRLAYANAVLPEALLAMGSVLMDQRLTTAGLRQLQWLLARETNDGHLSVTPAGGSGDGERTNGFDQQPIEVAAMSDACLRAYDVSGDRTWLAGHELALRWFLGGNDKGTPMFDPWTGGGYDGLTATGPNLNQGAESTLALLSTLQNARRFVVAAT